MRRSPSKRQQVIRKIVASSPQDIPLQNRSSLSRPSLDEDLKKMVGGLFQSNAVTWPIGNVGSIVPIGRSED